MEYRSFEAAEGETPTGTEKVIEGQFLQVLVARGLARNAIRTSAVRHRMGPTKASSKVRQR